MELVPIFDNVLYAIKYEGETKDEFRRLFDLWADPEYLEEFFEQNKKDITNGYYGTQSVEGAIFETYECAEIFEQKLLDLSKQNSARRKSGLDKIFKPLHENQQTILKLNPSKSRESWLRIYALRVESNIYIVTGGAIKLTEKMQDRRHTMVELRKIESCRKFLLDKGIVDIDKMIGEIES